MSEPNKKTKRIALSCDNCRRRKTKCDRGLPCSNCNKLSISHTCNYSSPYHVNHKRSFDEQNSTERFSIHQELNYLKDRLRQLESSVNTNGESVPLSSDSFSRYNESLRERGSYTYNDKAFIEQNKDLLLGELPHRNEESSINLHFTDDSSTNRITKPPLPYFSLSKRDPGVQLFWVFDSSPKYGEFTSKNLPLIRRGDDTKLESFKSMAKRTYGDKYIKSLQDGCSLREVKNSISDYGRPFGIIYHQDDLINMSLNQKIILLIPHQSITSRYLNTFFEYLYPFFPILDELTFRAELSRIMGTVNELTGKVEDLKIEKKSDYGIIATFFFVIRLSFILSFSNNHASNFEPQVDEFVKIGKEREAIMNSPVPLEVVNIAEECLRLFDLSKIQELVILQGLIFSRVYKKYAPEARDDFKVSEIQGGVGIIIQVAISMRLNRDPEYYINTTNDNIKVINLKRKIWSFLVELDIEDSLMFAIPMSTDRYVNHDTKLPFYTEGASNIVDIELEKDVSENISLSTTVHSIMEILAKSITNFKSSIKLTQFLKELSDMEFFCARTFGRLESLIKTNPLQSESFRITQAYDYILLKLFLAQMYFLCHIYYSDIGDNDLEFFYHKKVLTIMLYELGDLRNSNEYVRKGIFGRAFTVIVTPLINLYFHISCLMCASLFVRLSTTLRENIEKNLSNQENSLNVIQNLLSMSLVCTKGFLHSLSYSSQRYLFAWKVNKAHLYAIKLMNEIPIYESNTSWTNRAILNYSKEQFIELEMILSSHMSPTAISNKQIEANAKIVLESFKVLAPSALGSLETMDNMTIVRDIQTDNFWCELSKINLDNENEFSSSEAFLGIRNGLSEGMSVEIASTNNNATSLSRNISRNNYNSSQSQFDFFSDTSLFDVFKATNYE